MRKLRGKKARLNGSAVSNQRGVVVPIVVIGLLAILAVAGLALDGSHALGNKARMQNAVDAAALAAAKVLDETKGNTILARAAARNQFFINASSPGNHEMNDAYGAGDIGLDIDFSLYLNPYFVPESFVHGSIPSNNEWWVRVIATGFDTQTTLSRVLGIDEISTPARAVAGPSGPRGSGGGKACGIAPIAFCESARPDPDDEEDVLRVLRPKPGTTDAIGPGNYKLLRMNDEDGNECSGLDCLKKNLAGSYDTCIGEGSMVDISKTQPGQGVGPVAAGFNTRFNRYDTDLNKPEYHEKYPPDEYIDEQGKKVQQGEQGNVETVDGDYELKSCATEEDPTTDYIFLTNSTRSDYCKIKGKKFGGDFDASEFDEWPEGDWKVDLVTRADDINYNYCNYIGNPENCTPGLGPDPGLIPGSLIADGVAGRRLLRFPVVPCEGLIPGAKDIPVTGIVCLFMLQSLSGTARHGESQIFGQFIDVCPANGDSGSDPDDGSTGPLLYKIQLYKDPDSKDS